MSKEHNPDTGKPMSAEERAQRHAFDRAYARWLSARAALESPDGPRDAETMGQLGKECVLAERELMFIPSQQGWMVWRKLEAFGLSIEDEARDGQRADAFSTLALAAIKTDLIRLGPCDGTTSNAAE
jgi:hypothetical protein